jgi:anti-sigma factor RsiW
MNSCPEFREAIALHAAEVLEPERRSTLTRHLEFCADCRSRLKEIEALSNAVGSTLSSNADASQLTPGFHSRLMRRVQEDAAARRRPRLFWLGAWLTIPRLAFGSAVLCLGIWLWISRELRSSHNSVARNSPRTNGVVRQPRPAATPLPAALSLLSMSRAWNESDAALDQLLAREDKILLADAPPDRAWSTVANLTSQ